MMKRVKFSAGIMLPAIGQGTWHMGEDAGQRQQEVMALQSGLERGLALIDTAEMYAEGEAETVVGDALKGRREKAWLVSKVYPWNAGAMDAVKACERSLRRLKTDYLDLYLLHWRGNVPLTETITAMQSLQQSGKILHWGVSNFDSEDITELLAETGGSDCMANQVLYHLASRGIEYDLLPQCQQLQIPVMAYCPLAQGGRLQRQLMENAILRQIAQQKGISLAQLLLAWAIRGEGVMAIPKASSVAHVAENAAALDVVLNHEELMLINQAFPAPQHKMPLEMV
ncbi:aldo/keto reductase [Erwinia psidii]|uniref:aldo/keto reductase n=1 Tax=Erwinia psidii TaxID=69224 RepID=UPI00226B06A7|nr:aldo/keto reductase [Erwinia psidii]